MDAPEPLITRYTRWLAAERGLKFDATTTEGYDDHQSRAHGLPALAGAGTARHDRHF